MDDLLQLVHKAFPTLQFEGKEQLALSRYLDQLEPMQVCFSVKQHIDPRLCMKQSVQHLS